MSTLQIVCDVIILLGGAATAIISIMSLAGKPIKLIQKHRQKEMKENLKNTLEELLPKYFEDRDIRMEEILEDLDAIKDQNASQNAIIELLKNNVRDVLRIKIEHIYDTYCDEKSMPRYELENLEDLFRDYKKANGNHHIDKLYSRMKEWEIYDAVSKYDL